MFESLRRGWTMTKVSFKVLRADPEILALPLMAGVALAALIAVGIFTVPMMLASSATSAIPLFLAILGFYIVGYFLVIWFNAAVMEMATIRFNGGNPTIMDGLKKAGSKSHRIFQWAIIAGTVGLLLTIVRQLARDRNSFIGQIVLSIIEGAWNILTFFVLPIAVYRDVGPIDAIKASGSLMKRTFGDSVGAMAATSFIFLLIGLPGLLLVWFASGFLPLLVIGVVWMLGVAALSTAVNGILVAAVYKYANEGVMPSVFQQEGVRGDAVAW
jgi:hypothetical protein